MPRTLHDDDEPPPFLRTWNRIYAGVVVYLILLILAFYWFGLAWR